MAITVSVQSHIDTHFQIKIHITCIRVKLFWIFLSTIDIKGYFKITFININWLVLFLINLTNHLDLEIIINIPYPKNIYIYIFG